MKCVYNNKNNGLAIINVINNRLNISNDWKKKINSSTQFAKQMSLTKNPDLFWDSGYDSE